jgi:hypothetical protein
MDDPVSMTSGVEEVYEANLKSHEIETLGQLTAITDETMEYIAWHLDHKKGIPSSKLISIVKNNVKATFLQDESPTPMFLNHTKEANP